MATKTTKKPRIVGPRTIDTLNLADAHTAALAYLQRHRLLDDLDSGRILNATTAVVEAARSLGISTLGALIDQGHRCLETATGLSSITRFLGYEAAETAHQHRSALAMITAAAALAHAADPYPYLDALPNLQPRHGGSQRPVTDDEVLLLRLWALHQARLGPRNRSAVFHLLLTDAGSRPSENTQIKPIHFDDPSNPTHVDLPGVTNVVGARRIPLPEWMRPLLRDTLRQHLSRDPDARTRGVAYQGSAQPGGGVASASASGVFVRSMRDAGIVGAPEPLGLVRWRLGVTETREGTRIAKARSGYAKIDTMMDFIGYREEAAAPLEDLGDYATL